MDHSSPLFESMEQWTPEQLLAVVDFCQMLSDSIWLHHDQRLIEYLEKDSTTPRISWPDEAVDINSQLPFNDELSV